MTTRIKFFCSLVVLVPILTFASDSSRRDSAAKEVNECFLFDLRGKNCTPDRLQKDGTLLLRVYNTGDKSVLPTLMRLGSMSIGLRSLDAFFCDSLFDNTEDSLDALSSAMTTDKTTEKWLNPRLTGTACWCPKLSRERFDFISGKLTEVSQQSAKSKLAQDCRQEIEVANVNLLATYFPPKTFSGRAADFMVEWYSQALYTLQEQPLWPAAPQKAVYRFTWLRSFHPPVSITLTMLPEGGELRTHVLNRENRNVDTRLVNLNDTETARLQSLIQRAQFWSMATEGGQRGLDGAEWILEGVQGGQYHIVTRWSASETPFGKALQELLRLSGYKPDSEVY